MSKKPPKDVCQLFVDEAGVPDIFDRKGRVIIGQAGCSRYFLLGMLEVDDAEKLADSLTSLRLQLLADPFFNTAESFKPERKKTALLFHAKDDLPEVRVKVFDLLRSFGPALSSDFTSHASIRKPASRFMKTATSTRSCRSSARFMISTSARHKARFLRRPTP